MLDIPLTLYDPKSSWPKSDFERRAGVMADFLVVIEFLRNEKKIKWAQLKLNLIENDHLGDWSPGGDCWGWLAFLQPVRSLRKPSSES